MKIAPLFLALVLMLCTTTLSLAKDVQVKGYTRKDGTVVQGYTRHVKDKSEKPSETVEIKSYTRKDGKVVKGYNRKKTGIESKKN